jgi:hypothetical protein
VIHFRVKKRTKEVVEYVANMELHMKVLNGGSLDGNFVRYLMATELQSEAVRLIDKKPPVKVGSKIFR